MKQTLLVLTVLGAMLFLMGCDAGKPPPPPEQTANPPERTTRGAPSGDNR